MAELTSLAIAVLAGGAVFCGARARLGRPPVQVRARRQLVLGELAPAEGDAAPEKRTALLTLARYARRLMRWPFYARLVSLLANPGVVRDIYKRLVAAGLAEGMAPAELVATRLLCGLALGAVFLVPALAGVPEARALVAMLFLGGYMLPSVLLSGAVERRREEIRRSLPKAIDVLVVGVEAGLPFDAAARLYCERFGGPLAEELHQVQRDVAVGMRRREALVHMAERCDVEDLNLFVIAVVQAERFGAPMSQVLRGQSREMKTRRRQWIQEQAMRAPVKMLFPVAFLILPALFFVLLGPLGIRLVTRGFG